jgi:hypothetical protein
MKKIKIDWKQPIEMFTGIIYEPAKIVRKPGMCNRAYGVSTTKIIHHKEIVIFTEGGRYLACINNKYVFSGKKDSYKIRNKESK